MRVLVLAKAVPLVRQGRKLFEGVQGGVGWLGRAGPQGNTGAKPTVSARLIENVRNGAQLGERSIKKWCSPVLLHLVKVPADLPFLELILTLVIVSSSCMTQVIFRKLLPLH